ncbi:helix-hairpin-helix domain-containing protein [Anthocerotibacter panamensis]|uniref:helix-hairpin-helix domain-containing protein n=1 Tax=Anthocerotibacter panamensis TaxID=2857077 RepID=UPI001C402D90|nr:helix-hairpin-helix domain-containing protein [Anthocerotibacter panamensis]
MSKTRSVPNWFYASVLPGVGWLTLLWAGYRARERAWILAALVYGALSLVGLAVNLSPIFVLAWIAGIVHLALVKDRYSTNLSLTDAQTAIRTLEQAHQAREMGVRIDVNQATQHELVYKLNLPIIQANKILQLRQAGVLFTCMEELSAYTGIPLAKLQAVAPVMHFSYYEFGSGFERWTRVNALSAAEIVREFDLSLELSQRLVIERDERGAFTSLAQLRERIALPYDQLGKMV